MLDLDEACVQPRWTMLPVMLLKPFEISRTELSCPRWQNTMLMRCVQLSIPLLYLSPLYFFTISENICRGIRLVIWEKSVNFTMGVGLLVNVKLSLNGDISNSHFLTTIFYFGRMWVIFGEPLL